MELVDATFRERVDDIQAYFEFVEGLEREVVSGVRVEVSPQQLKIMYAGIYLQLYNMVEAIVCSLIEAVERAVFASGEVHPVGFTEAFRNIYVKSVLGTSESLNAEQRLERALIMYNQLLHRQEFEVKISTGGGGNWDLESIKKISKSLGVDFDLPRSLKTRLERPHRDGKGVLFYIKSVRNKLAHGSISFSECGDSHSISDFREVIELVREFLHFLVEKYRVYLESQYYFQESHRADR